MSYRTQPKIHIIGAGVSGLVAAATLEAKGYQPVILEASHTVGGRVKTDMVEGYQMDHGFQVLLESYPYAQKHLDYEALQLQKLQPGAVIFEYGKKYTIGDPVRNFGFLFSTLTANIGSIGDKFKILKLNRQLKRKTIEKIFESQEATTLEYLQDFGFTDTIIQKFFRPFFTGIFLEPDLQTSSRMFEFVYKMFGEGLATIPKAGAGAISEQLYKKLSKTDLQFDSRVTSISEKRIALANGEEIDSDFIIIATHTDDLIPQMATTTEWKSCENLYFKTNQKVIDGALIGLNARKNAFVNNIFYPTSIESASSQSNDELLSVTVVKKHDLPLEDLILMVKDDLRNDFGITDTYFLKYYSINRALPDLQDLKYKRQPSESLIMRNMAIAGDQLLNGSLNAAMIAGEAAAEACHEVLSGEKV